MAPIIIIIIIMAAMAAHCCSCNGSRAVCKRCSCVRSGNPCTSCHPSMIGKCSNQVSSLDVVQSSSPRPRDVRHLIPTVDSSEDTSELMFESSEFLGED